MKNEKKFDAMLVVYKYFWSNHLYQQLAAEPTFGEISVSPAITQPRNQL